MQHRAVPRNMAARKVQSNRRALLAMSTASTTRSDAVGSKRERVEDAQSSDQPPLKFGGLEDDNPDKVESLETVYCIPFTARKARLQNLGDLATSRGPERATLRPRGGCRRMRVLLTGSVTGAMLAQGHPLRVAASHPHSVHACDVSS